MDHPVKIEPALESLHVAAKSPVSRRRQWWLVVCLTMVSMLAMIDKHVLTLLVSAIKADLRLSDTQVGLIIGAAFALANIAVSIPAGWLADRANRRALIAGGVALWSLMAALCGAAGSFWQLFLARAGVGLGEGIIPPPSYSLIRDGVSAERRSLAFSVYGMAGSVGAGLSLVVGGALVGMIAASGAHKLPVVGLVAPWQMALFIIAIGGLPFIFLTLAFPDPGRSDGPSGAASFQETFKLLRERGWVVGLLLLYSVFHAMISQSLAAWLPALMGRNFGLRPQEIGPTLGLLLMVMAPIGLGSAGWLMDRIARKDPSGAALTAVLSSIVLLISATWVAQAHSIRAFWVLEALVILSSTVFLPVTSTLIADIMPSRAIGKSIALFLMVQGVCGSGLAPVIAAFVGDHVFAGQLRGLAQAMSWVCGAYGSIALIAALALWSQMRKAPRQAP